MMAAATECQIEKNRNVIKCMKQADRLAEDLRLIKAHWKI